MHGFGASLSSRSTHFHDLGAALTTNRELECMRVCVCVRRYINTYVYTETYINVLATQRMRDPQAAQVHLLSCRQANLLQEFWQGAGLGCGDLRPGSRIEGAGFRAFFGNFSRLRARCVGVLMIRALVFGVYIEALDFENFHFIFSSELGSVLVKGLEMRLASKGPELRSSGSRFPCFERVRTHSKDARMQQLFFWMPCPCTGRLQLQPIPWHHWPGRSRAR